MWRSLVLVMLLGSPAIADCPVLFGIPQDADGDGCCNGEDYDPYDPAYCNGPCDPEGGDADGDGACASTDYDDNDPGVQTPPPCASSGGDADGDGWCANVDYDDNDPLVQSAPGAGSGGSDPPDVTEQVSTMLTLLATVAGLIITANIMFRVILLVLRWVERAGG